MIFLYTGTPGSGKSAHAARVLRNCLKRKQHTFANFLVNSDSEYFHFVSNQDLQPKILYEFARSLFGDSQPKEGSINLFIDEAQLIFNSRTWNDANRLNWLEFFSQHRHFGFDVFLICQQDIMIDKQFRSLIEYEVKHAKVSQFSWLGSLMSCFGLLPLHVANSLLYSQKSMRTSSDFFLVTPSLRAFYNSYALFEQKAVFNPDENILAQDL